MEMKKEGLTGKIIGFIAIVLIAVFSWWIIDAASNGDDDDKNDVVDEVRVDDGSGVVVDDGPADGFERFEDEFFRFTFDYPEGYTVGDVDRSTVSVCEDESPTSASFCIEAQYYLTEFDPGFFVFADQPDVSEKETETIGGREFTTYRTSPTESRIGNWHRQYYEFVSGDYVYRVFGRSETSLADEQGNAVRDLAESIVLNDEFKEFRPGSSDLFGIGFEYPSDWSFGEDESGLFFRSPFAIEPHWALVKGEQARTLSELLNRGGNPPSVTDIVIDGVSAKEVLLSSGDKEVIFELDGVNHQITGLQDYNRDIQEFYETIRFVDQDSSVFSGDKFSFSYPSGWYTYKKDEVVYVCEDEQIGDTEFSSTCFHVGLASTIIFEARDGENIEKSQAQLGEHSYDIYAVDSTIPPLGYSQRLRYVADNDQAHYIDFIGADPPVKSVKEAMELAATSFSN